MSIFVLKKGSKAMLKPEEKALLLLARQDISKNNIKMLKNLINDGLNYDYLAMIAQEHQVASIVGYHLLHNPLIKNYTSIPDKEFVKTMIFANIMAQAHNKKMYKELDRLQCLFSEHNISFVVLKGPGIAKLVYKCAGGRIFGDLDLLIAPNNIKKAHELLISDGYKAYNLLGQLVEDQEITETNTAHLLIYMKDFYTVELHQYRGEYEIDLSKLFNNAKPLKLNNEMVLVPDEIDLFIHSCAHLESHIKLLVSKTPIPLQPPSIKIIKQLNVKQFMDIRESYLSLPNKENEITRRIEEFGINDLIYRAISLTERIYGKFSTLKLKPDRHFNYYHWHAENWESYIERRLFSYREEQKKIIKRSREEAKKKQIYKCFYKTNSELIKHENIYYNMPSIYANKQYLKYLLEKTTNQYSTDDLYPQFSISWNEQNFYFTHRISIDKFQNKQQVYQFGYQLLFGLDRNEFVKVIFIKPLKSGKHKAFMWQQEYTQGRYIPIEIG